MGDRRLAKLKRKDGDEWFWIHPDSVMKVTAFDDKDGCLVFLSEDPQRPVLLAMTPKDVVREINEALVGAG